MATLTVIKLSLTGVDPALVAAAAGGDKFLVGKGTYLHVKNTSAATRTVTVDSKKNCNQGSDHDSVTTVPITTGERMIGPFEDVDRWGDPNTKLADITYDAVPGLTIAAVQL